MDRNRWITRSLGSLYLVLSIGIIGYSVVSWSAGIPGAWWILLVPFLPALCWILLLPPIYAASRVGDLIGRRDRGRGREG